MADVGRERAEALASPARIWQSFIEGYHEKQTEKCHFPSLQSAGKLSDVSCALPPRPLDFSPVYNKVSERKLELSGNRTTSDQSYGISSTWIEALARRGLRNRGPPASFDREVISRATSCTTVSSRI